MDLHWIDDWNRSSHRTKRGPTTSRPCDRVASLTITGQTDDVTSYSLPWWKTIGISCWAPVMLSSSRPSHFGVWVPSVLVFSLDNNLAACQPC